VSDGNITRISAQEALRRIEQGESLTDWERVRAMSEAEVEAAAAADLDWQDVDPDRVSKAEPACPLRKSRLTPPSTKMSSTGPLPRPSLPSDRCLRATLRVGRRG
jgi:hypothetical protein